MNTRLRMLVSVVAIVTATAACSSGAAATFPPSPSSPSVASADAAAALVIASNPRFAGLKARDPNLIGGCCFYQVASTASGYTVTIEVGWGDCPAGCINRHHWIYSVTSGGTVSLDREDGPPVPAGVPGGSGGTGGGTGGSGTGPGIVGVALAGPTCPVVQPGQPGCDDRPVAGATVHIVASDGTEVATMTTDAAGRFMVELPAGEYRVTGDAVNGVMHGPAEVAVTVGTTMVAVKLEYDTGIR